MCVADGRAAFFTRPAFLGLLAGAAAPLVGGAGGLEAAVASVLSRTTALALYDALARSGPDAFEAALRRTEAQLAPVRV